MSPRQPVPIGARFWRLTVVGGVHVRHRHNWECVCDCGKRIVTQPKKLRSGHTKSCGCLRAERSYRHGMSHHYLYAAWHSMQQRCNNPTSPSYYLYGARGIKICDRWMSSFEDFVADMGERPSPEHSIDRRDGTKGYSPENCRWATPLEQQFNTARSIAKRARELGAKIMSNSSFDDVRRSLIAEREKHGASSSIGMACSSLVEQMENLQTYERPSWAVDDRQSLHSMIKRQTMRLERLRAAA
jgi:hypothetical protein